MWDNFGMYFAKYHALGNDYLVMGPASGGADLTPIQIRRICHRNFGIGADGIMWGPLDVPGADFEVRIYNPDGGEAEKSGNGLRIFTRCLYDRALIGSQPVMIWTVGGTVTAQVGVHGKLVTVAMGQASFSSEVIPVAGLPREVVRETIAISGRTFVYSAVTVGNPHCVVLCDEISEQMAREWGPRFETAPRFPNRTNVQFMRRIDAGSIAIEIWERGAGYTLASGSSSCAAAAAAYRLGWCGPQITVHMPGGTLEIEVARDYAVTMTGPVAKVAEGTLSLEMFG